MPKKLGNCSKCGSPMGRRQTRLTVEEGGKKKERVKGRDYIDCWDCNHSRKKKL